jgi:hypothetical protein
MCFVFIVYLENSNKIARTAEIAVAKKNSSA